MRMLDDSVLIQLDPPDKTQGLIILVKKVDQKQGTVLAVGPGKLRLSDGKRNPLAVKPGDRVMFDGFAAFKFKEEDQQVIVQEEHILGVIDAVDTTRAEASGTVPQEPQVP